MTTIDSPVLQSGVKKAMVRIIPFAFLCFFLSFLDRVNLSYAALTMNADIGLSDAAYGLGAGIFFIGYFVFEVPSNLLLNRFGARIWISRIMITWGVISACMALVSNEPIFYILRFLLGVAEAGFFPGIIFYFTKWFPLRNRGRATALFMTAMPISGIIGAPLSGWILGLDGFMNMSGWQILFIVEGVPSIIVGFLVLIFLPDNPTKVKWLSKEEASAIIEALATEEKAAASGGHSTLRDAFKSPLVWWLSLAFFGTVTSLLSLSFWLPTIIQSLTGQGTMMTTLISALPYIFAAASMILIARSSDRTGERRLHTSIAAATAGVALVLCVFSPNPVMTIGLLCVVAAGIYGCNGTFWTISTARLAGTAAAAGIAWINSIGNLGGFVGPYVLGWLREYTGGDQIGMAFLAVLAFMSAAILFVVGPKRKKSPEVTVSTKKIAHHS